MKSKKNSVKYPNKKNNITITNTTRAKIPKIQFPIIKNKIIGEKYDLSIAIISKKKIQTINKQYRKKDKPTNVLAFELDKKSGEILICPEIIKKQTSLFEKKYTELFCFLVIHAMLHLKGYAHGSKMEKAEKQLLKKFFK